MDNCLQISTIKMMSNHPFVKLFLKTTIEYCFEYILSFKNLHIVNGYFLFLLSSYLINININKKHSTGKWGLILFPSRAHFSVSV